jgi:hypothetical protein
VNVLNDRAPAGNAARSLAALGAQQEFFEPFEPGRGDVLRWASAAEVRSYQRSGERHAQARYPQGRRLLGFYFALVTLAA